MTAVSAKWQTNEDDITNLANASASWNSVFTTVNLQSGEWNSTWNTLTAVSAKWQDNEDDIATNATNITAKATSRARM